MIRAMKQSDLEAVVEVHLRSFPNFFLTFLGRRFLVLLYAGIQADPGGVVLVAESSEGVQGFVAGVLEQEGFYRRLIRGRVLAFGCASFGAMVRRPAIAPRLLRAFGRAGDSRQAVAEACLMSLAVLPGVQRSGVGSELVRAFCRELKARGAKAVCLTTDKDQNDSANNFYEKLGFQVCRSYTTPEKRRMNERVLQLK